jgi:hypothetical protein
MAGLVVAPLMVVAPMSMMLTDRDRSLSDDPSTSASDTMGESRGCRGSQRPRTT